MRSYNGTNDRSLAPSAGVVEYKHQVAGSHGTGRWHRSRVPKVLLEHSWSYAVVSTLGLVRCHSAALAASRSYHMSRFDDEHRLTPCRHVR